MARRTRTRTQFIDPPVEWDAEQEARELEIARSWLPRWTAEDAVDYERWLDSLPKPTDEEVAEFEAHYLDKWERQAYTYDRR